MHKSALVLFVAYACCSSAISTRTVDNHLDANDFRRLQKVFSDGLVSNDLQSIYYASLNIETNSANKQALCSRLQNLHEESKLNDFEKDLYLVGINNNLRCVEKLPQTLLTKINTAFKSDPATVQEIYYRVSALKVLGTEMDEAALKKVIKILQDLLKKDDSLPNLGYTFNIAAELGNTALAFVADRVEDAVVQADEVDGRMLQFEGGLSITALVVNGAFKVTKTFNKPTPITPEQTVKLATYFLSRRSVQTAKGAHILLEALKTLSGAGKIAPVCIQIIGNGQIEAETPTLNIAVVDLLGKVVSPALQNIFGKVILKKDNSVLAEKVQFLPKSSDKTVFTTNMSIYKPTRGIYAVEISADNIYTQTLAFKVLGRVKILSLEIGIAELDAGSVFKKQNVNYPNKLPETLELDNTQKLMLKAILIDDRTSKTMAVHQAFVRLYNREANREAIFIAEQDSSKAYKFDMEVGVRAGDFGYKSGQYEMYFMVGDASISNSFQWHIANIVLKFASEAKETKKQPIRSALPEIIHQFRPPEKRPPRFVSDIFTGLCLTPLVLLFLLWGKLKINVSNFTIAPSTLGFHIGFGSILVLFGIFWLKLNMFQTLRLLIPLAVFTFLCGNRLLRHLFVQRVYKSGAVSISS